MEALSICAENPLTAPVARARDAEGTGVPRPPVGDRGGGLRRVPGLGDPADRIGVGRAGRLHLVLGDAAREERLAHGGVLDQVEEVGGRPPEPPSGPARAGERGRGATSQLRGPAWIATGEVARDGVADDVVEDEALAGLLAERQAPQAPERGRGRGRPDERAEERLVDAAQQRRRADRLERLAVQALQKGVHELTDDRGRRAVRELEPRLGAHRRRRQLQRQRVPAGEGVRPLGPLGR